MAARNTDASWIKSLIDVKEEGINGKEHWILKTKVKKSVEESRIQVLTIGEQNDKPVKTVLLLGQTGSGKTLLLNGFVNHIFNIKYDSPFRLKLRDQIVGEPRDKTQSQTDYVTALLIYHQEGMLYDDYNLMIIDTPGFDDTRGNDIFTNLYVFFMSDFGINCLNCIGLVMKGNENRSLTHQKKLLKDIVSLLGKDCSNITRLLCTFAYFGTPVVDVVRNAGIKVAGVDRFENFPLSSLFVQNSDADCSDSSALWENMSKGYCKFFQSLPYAASVNVKKTRELCKSLKELGELKDKLRGIANATSTLYEEVEKHYTQLSKLNKEFVQLFWNSDGICYRYVGEGLHAHNCLKCGQCCLKCKDPSNVLAYAAGIGIGAVGCPGLGVGAAVLTGMIRGLQIGKFGGPIGIGIGIGVGAVVGAAAGYLAGKALYKTKNDCSNKCSHDGCQHDQDVHEISFEEIVPKWAIGDNLTLEHKRRYEELKKGIQDANEALGKCLKEFNKRESETKKELKRLISVTEYIGKLSSGLDTPTPAKVLKELEDKSSGAFCFNIYKFLKDCLSEIEREMEAEIAAQYAALQ